jgi:hypothetical protein
MAEQAATAERASLAGPMEMVVKAAMEVLAATAATDPFVAKRFAAGG